MTISRSVRIFVFALVLMLAACSGEKKRTATPAEAPKAVALSSDLLKKVPEEACGFFVWKGSHDAYKRLMESPWSGSGDFASMIQDSSGEVGKAAKLLTAVGLDPNDKETWRNMFSEAVFFALPPKAESPEPSIGVVFRSQGIEIADKLAAIKEELKKSGTKVEDISIEGVGGVKFEVEQQAGEQKLQHVYFLVNDGLGVFGSKEEAIAQVLKKKSEALPSIVTASKFERTTFGLPAEKNRFAIGYFDLEQLFASPAADTAAKETPLKAASMALSMGDTPQTDVRMLYEDTADGENWAASLKPSSSAALVPSVPKQPLLFLSFDGQTLKKVKELAAAKAKDQNPQLLSQLSFVDSLQRVGIAARVAPVGQSILPIPDLLFLMQTSEPAAAEQQLKSLISGAMQGSPMTASMQWTEKELEDGKKMQALMSPMGFGVFLASTDSLVLAASTEAQLRSILAGSENGLFQKALSPGAVDVFSEQPNIGSLYLNFEQVGAFMENMGGLLAMYAPQDKNAQSMLEAENIKAIKKMGTMIGSVTIDKGVIGIKSFYQAKS